MSTASPKKKIPYHHHHVLRHKQQAVATREPALVEQEVVDKLLVDCIKTICEEEALKQKIADPVIESVALESMVAALEEFMLRLLSTVRRSMLAARRTTPTALDLESAIQTLHLPRPDDQLRPYETPSSIINPPLLPTPPPEDSFHNTVALPASFLGPELDGHGELKKFAFSPLGLPELPSAHTYKDTAVYPQREADSRKIRELATHEGKLGEQALRKLAGAVKLDAAYSADPGATVKQKLERGQRKRSRTGVNLSEEAVFEETLRELLAREPEGFELGPIVTCEKAYRMPDDTQVKRRAQGDGAASGGPGKTGVS